MSASDLEDFYVHTAVVETLLGTDGYGADHFAPPVTLSPATGSGCFVENTRKLVRDKKSQGRGNEGQQVVSETTLYTYPTAARLFTPGSRVTIGDAQSRVITTALADSGTLDLPDHVAVSLT